MELEFKQHEVDLSKFSEKQIKELENWFKNLNLIYIDQAIRSNDDASKVFNINFVKELNNIYGSFLEGRRESRDKKEGKKVSDLT